MWIRSQKKDGIFKIISCRILSSNKGCLIEGVSKTGNILGEYSTKEKALKVIDLIEEAIDSQHMSPTVFQMPQDDEVE